ncbi:MAG: LysR substrate-binding domain-containing protein [Granulosicoccaceae bacterium]|jgi:DNA-binding transcriptional LysR family regulator
MAYLDFELLETFVAIVECGSFTHAGEWLNKTQSTVSQQLKRLEERTGVALLARNTRIVTLTEQGELLLEYARRLLELQEQALRAINDTRIEGQVRIGIAQDIADGGLADMLAHFGRLYPKVRMEVRVDANCTLREAVRNGALDFAVVLQEVGDGGEVIDRMKRVWVASPGFQVPVSEPIPLVLLDAPCIFRNVALEALDREGIAWRIALTTPSLAGLHAAVQSGLGISVRMDRWLEDNLQVVASYLPSLPEVELAIHTASATESPISERLRECVHHALDTAKGMIRT